MTDWVNTANPWADNEVSDTLTLVDGSTISATCLRSGTVPNARLDSSSVTLQGNTFNGANQLVQLDGSGALPIISGANLTNITATNIGANTVGTTQIINSTVALVDLNTTDVDKRYLTTGTDQTITGIKTISSDWVNTANPWADSEVSDILTLVDGSTISATSLPSGTVPNARLDSSSVT